MKEKKEKKIPQAKQWLVASFDPNPTGIHPVSRIVNLVFAFTFIVDDAKSNIC